MTGWGTIGSEENAKARAKGLLESPRRKMIEIEDAVDRGQWRKAVAGYDQLMSSMAIQRWAAAMAAKSAIHSSQVICRLS